MSFFDDYHRYHGAALNIIAEQKAFSSINKYPGIDSRATYLLNHNTALFIKHSTVDELKWSFTFTSEHQDILKKLYDGMGERTYILLICKTWVCVLTYEEYASCLDVNHTTDEWLEVRRPQGGGYRVRGANRQLPNVVPLNRFPDILF
jgi:hypothetical protein